MRTGAFNLVDVGVYTDGETLWLDGERLEPTGQRRLLALLLSMHRDMLDSVDRRVLEAVETSPGAAETVIAQVAGYSNTSTVSVALSRLRRLGLVDRANRAVHG